MDASRCNPIAACFQTVRLPAVFTRAPTLNVNAVHSPQATAFVKKIKVERDDAKTRASTAEEDVSDQQGETQTMITFSAKQTDAIGRLKLLAKSLGGDQNAIDDAADVLKKR